MSSSNLRPGRHLRVVVTGHGGPEVLAVVEEDRPMPGPGEVRVAVMAAGVSAFDLLYRRWSRLPGRPRTPFTLGQDVVGTVDAVGEGVRSLSIGQLVTGATWASGFGGGYAESVCLPEDELVPVPPGVDPADAVCLVVNYLTAHQHLHAYGGARRGERLLVHGAAGGVGTALLQLGSLAGLEMFGTAAEPHHPLIASLGATPIGRRDDFVTRVRAPTGDGVDIVIDTVGGPRHLWRSYRALRRHGRLVWLGAASAKRGGLGPGLLALPTIVLLGILPDGKRAPVIPDVGRYAAAHPGWYRETLTMLLSRLASGEIRPVIAQRIPLTEAARAHALLERGGLAGKIVLVTGAFAGHPNGSR